MKLRYIFKLYNKILNKYGILQDVSCAVAMCKSTTIKTANKLFIHVPQCPRRREQWFLTARRDPKLTNDKCNYYFCEDHFDLPNDMENYMQYSVMGFVGKIRMRPECLPSKFECHPDREQCAAPLQARPAVEQEPNKEVEAAQDLSQETGEPVRSDVTVNSGQAISQAAVCVKQIVVHVKQEVIEPQDTVDLKEVADPQGGVDIKQEVMDQQDNSCEVKQEVIDPEYQDVVVKKEYECADTRELNQHNVVLPEDRRVELEVEFEVPGAAGGSGTAHASERETRATPGAQGLVVAPVVEVKRGRPPHYPPPAPPHLCAASYQTPSNLEAHMRTHSGDKPFPCDICDSRFTKLNDLKRHYRTHKGDKRFKWKTRHKQFTQLAASRVDQGVTGAHPRSCEDCDKSFSDSSDLKTDERYHSRPFGCDSCGRRFCRSCDLTTHLRTHTGEKPYKCTTCGKAFAQTSALTKHERLHSGYRPYACEVCHKRFTGQSDLKKHEKIHRGEVKREHACDTCGRRFEKSRDLDAHRRTHTGEKPFKCDECNKEFTQLGSLTKHKRIHTGYKPYPCTVCDKRFSEKTGLMKHERRHTGEKPYSCATCQKKFAQLTHFRNHERIHTGEKPYGCEVCDKKFTQKVTLKRHQRIHEV